MKMLVSLVIQLAVVGVLLWALNTYIPMDAGIKKLINVVVIIAAVFYVLSAFGVLSYVNVPLPRLN